MFYVYLIILVSILITPCDVYASQLRVDVVSTMDRVFKDINLDKAGAKKITIFGARNEYESSQVMLVSDGKVKLERVEVSNLVDADTKNSISNEYCEIRIPEYVHVEWNTRATPVNELDGRAPRMYPDPLPEFKPFYFEGARSIWLTCYIPKTALPGNYQGELNLKFDGIVKRLPIELNVWGFSLPSESSLYVTNWLHVSQLVKHYNVRRYSGDYWRLINLVAKDLKAHRQNVIFMRLNIIEVKLLANGKYVFDFANYEKWVKLFLKYGFQAFEAGPLFHPKSFNIYDSTTRKRIRFNKSTLKKFLESKNGKVFLAQFLKELYQKNKQLGINKIYLQHVGDEAKVDERELYRDIVKLVHQAMPEVPVIDATHLGSHMRKDMMDIPVTNMHSDEAPIVSDIARSWGRWWYTAGFNPRGKMPNRFIDYPLLKMRMIPWLSWRYGMSGYLHYAYNWWQLPDAESPWNMSQYKNYSPGDAWIVYPPTDHVVRTPVSSLRWEIFRDGLEDYEYFILLNKSVESLNKMLLNETDTDLQHNIKARLEKGKLLLSHLKNQIRSKIDYPRNTLFIEETRYNIGEWLSANVIESGGPVQ